MSTIENNKRIAKNSLYLYVRMFFVLAITLYTTRALLNSLGVLDYGIYQIVGGIVAFIAFLQSAMANGFQRFFNIAIGKNDACGLIHVFSASVSVQIIISVGFFVIAETLGIWFLNTQLIIPNERIYAANVVYQSVIIVFLLTMIASPCNAIVIAYERMKIFAAISILDVLLKLVIVYIVVFGADRLILYSVLTIIVQMIIAILYAYYAFKLNPALSFRPKFERKQIINLVSFSGWNLFGSLAHTAKGQGLNVVLNLFFDPTINAARGVAYQVSAGVSQFFLNFQTASRPQIIKYYAQGEYDEMLNLTYRISKFSFMLLWIIDLPLLFTSDYFIKLWIGDKMPAYAPLFTTIVLITVTIECFAQPISTLVHATGKMRNFQIITSLVILLILPIAYCVLWLGAPPESALYCSLFLAPLAQLVRLCLVKRLVPLSICRYMLNVIVPSCTVAFVSYIAVRLSLYVLPLSPIVLALYSGCIAIVVIWFVGCNRLERAVILKFTTNNIITKIHV